MKGEVELHIYEPLYHYLRKKGKWEKWKIYISNYLVDLAAEGLIWIDSTTEKYILYPVKEKKVERRKLIVEVADSEEEIEKWLDKFYKVVERIERKLSYIM